jgi:glycosyltransferase involved in cell wall biosynthesis
MRLGIDASNIRAGGGVTHLVELLSAADPPAHGFERVTVWAGTETLARLPDRPWLSRGQSRHLDGSLPVRLYWQARELPRFLAQHDLLFVPGGTYVGMFHPFVTMSRNLLPFDARERARFGLGATRAKFHLLERAQARTFRCADGAIYLTETARRQVASRIGTDRGTSVVIPHGVSGAFRKGPSSSRPLAECSCDHPFRWLYVSIVDLYKHHWHVAEAVAFLRAQGLPVSLDLVGPPTKMGLRRLQQTLSRVDPQGQYIRYLGGVPYAQLSSLYHEADAFAFASSCETFGQILLEAMSAGLPIACSDRSTMPETLGDAGLYFDPESPDSIAAAMRQLMESESLRQRLARAAYVRALQYSWERCAHETFTFLATVARSFHGPKGE